MLLDVAKALGASGAPVTALVGLLNLAVFAATHTGRAQIARLLHLQGATVAHLVSSGAIALPWTAHEPFRLISADWVHIGLLHLGMNLFALLRFGAGAERAVGPARYAVAYVATGVAGFGLSTALASGMLVTAGASASLFGLLGVELGWLLARRDPRWKQVFFATAINAALFALVLPVNNSAHVGGYVAGVAFGWVYTRERRPWRHDAAFRAAAIACGVLVLASLVLAKQSPVSRRALDDEQRRMDLEGELE